MNRHSLIKTFEKLILKLKFLILFLLMCLFTHIQTHAQTPEPTIISQKTLGGSSNEILNSTYATSDGGYIMGGQTSSSNGDVQGSRKGLSDGWIVKTNASGTIEWQVDLADSRDDVITSVKETTDQGFIVLGYTSSSDGDFFGNHGGTDIFVAKLSKTGSVEWVKCFGGTLDEKSGEIVVSSEGGYLFTGSAKSFNGDLLSKFPVDADAWVVKITNTATISWQQLFNGNYFDFCKAAKQLPSKNYVVVSNIGTASGTNQREDIFVSILQPNGNVNGQNSYGGSRQDLATSLETTPDGGFVILGKSNSNNGTLTKNQGNFDVWLLKMTATGTMQWQKTFGGSEIEGGSGTDTFGTIKPTDDGGYVFTSNTNSKNGDIQLPATPWTGTNARVWVVKLNCKQDIQWQKILGGNSTDYGVFVNKNADESYTVTANANSVDGNVLGNKGGQDFWFIHLSKDPKPKANLVASGPLVFCESNSIKLNADIGNQYKYQWQKDGVDITGEINSRITISQSGDYKVLITPKDCPKPQTDTSAKITVTQKPKLGLPIDTTFCKNPMQLSANQINGATYLWSSGENTPNIAPTSAGTYKLNVKIGGCEVDSSVNVKQSSAPIITLRNQIEDCFDVSKPYILSAGTDLTLRYRWSPNNETSNNINVSQEGTYKVKVTNTDGCSTEKAVVMIQKCISKIYAANIFTPNADGDNDVFWISTQDVTEYDLKIFNRWGEIFFASTSESEVWDGNYRSAKAEEGTYSWKLSYRNVNQNEVVQVKMGVILLVR
jgi:gliding motility-associated-like protein